MTLILTLTLTGPQVRPQPVLEMALDRLEHKWQAKEHEYIWICDQLKAVRQDLTVQHIQNEFTAKVYETHARIALMEKVSPRCLPACLLSFLPFFPSSLLASFLPSAPPRVSFIALFTLCRSLPELSLTCRLFQRT